MNPATANFKSMVAALDDDELCALLEAQGKLDAILRFQQGKQAAGRAAEQDARAAYEQRMRRAQLAARLLSQRP
jgi:hypothetical protein